MHKSLRLIIAAIKEDGRPLKIIAAKAGITLQTLYNWINGRVYCGQHLTMAKVAQVLGLEWRLVRAN